MIDPDLEAMARELCRAEGLDPEEAVDAGLLDRLTEAEQLAHRSGAGETHVRVPRWMIYRRRAEQMLGASRE